MHSAMQLCSLQILQHCTRAKLTAPPLISDMASAYVHTRIIHYKTDCPAGLGTLLNQSRALRSVKTPPGTQQIHDSRSKLDLDN